MKQRPLDGVRVADLTMMWAGPYATKLLAEMGAEVIKVESPRAWDNIRTLLPQPGVADPWNSAFYFNEYNRDKKSLILDLADERGHDAFLQVVAQLRRRHRELPGRRPRQARARLRRAAPGPARRDPGVDGGVRQERAPTRTWSASARSSS